VIDQSKANSPHLTCQRCRKHYSVGTYYGGEKPLSLCGHCAEALGIDPESSVFLLHEIYSSAVQVIRRMKEGKTHEL
jgi:ATP sulfurylase